MRLLSLYFLLLSITAFSQEPEYGFVIFANSRMDSNYFFSRVNYGTGSEIHNLKGKVPVTRADFFTPGNSILLQYLNAKGGNWHAGIARQALRGQDHFKKKENLSFWIRVPDVNSIEALPSVKLVTGDSVVSKQYEIKLKATDEWQRVLIPLSQFGFNKQQVERTIGVIFSQYHDDGKWHTIFIDDIELTPPQRVMRIATIPVLKSVTGYAMHTSLAWDSVFGYKYVKIYRSDNGELYHPVAIQSARSNRYDDFTGETGKTYRYKISFVHENYDESSLSNEMSATTRAMSDEEFLTMVQEATFRYFWDGAESNSGLAKENIPGRVNMIASGASGFGIMALIVGTERKFITRDQSIQRFEKITRYLEKAKTFHGAFPHFIDGPTGKVEPFFGNRDNGGDLVETSFLIQGLLAARQYFDKPDPREKAIRDRITRIWERVEWNWYRQYPNSKFLYWHWSPDQAWVINHTLVGWNETMVTYLLAIASPTHPVPASMYYTGWANQDSTGIKYRSGWGGTMEGSKYTNGNTYYGIKLDVGVSNGGPLFFTHFSYMGYDPHMLNDRYTNYYTNNKNISLINYRYCVANPRNYVGYGDSCWGLSASEGPYDYSPDEPIPSRDHGKITPTAAISSFPYTPEESMKALKNFYYSYGKFLWGEYGFLDAFNLTDNWTSDIYMGLSQSTTVVMLENYRSGLLWKLFMSNKDIQNGLKKLEAVK